jgi:hypothetical protein
MASNYYRDIISTIIMSSTSLTTAAAHAIFTFSPYNPQSTSRAAHFVSTVNLQGVPKNSLNL